MGDTGYNSTGYTCFDVEVRDRIARLTMKRPERANSMIAEFWTELPGIIDDISACDLRYATSDAFFVIQEINIGMTADVGTLQRMPKLVPEGVVRELAYTGRRMGAEEALDRGFVNAVYDDHASMMEAVHEIAAQIAAKSPMAVWGTKQTMNYSRDHSVADGLEYIATWNAAMFDTDDMGEAFRSQLDKRDAEFPGHRPLHGGLAT
ncbi:enoyl-CoA hydratase-related protein [Candidatus Poriferisodalis sp.]|uniref:enoyl-CoA hydratase-related protein n=1 Tax=Candidatus Poriferisodalis sp. TaxID=3101277 RepID=UPI003C6FD0B2